MPTADDAPARGFTPEDLSRRFRVSPDKVRLWIKNGKLRAINTADAMCGKPRFVVTPEALREFEEGRTVAPPVKPQKRRRRPAEVDFFPD
jgi:hypothetical protein